MRTDPLRVPPPARYPAADDHPLAPLAHVDGDDMARSQAPPVQTSARAPLPVRTPERSGWAGDGRPNRGTDVERLGQGVDSAWPATPTLQGFDRAGGPPTRFHVKPRAEWAGDPAVRGRAPAGLPLVHPVLRSDGPAAGGPAARWPHASGGTWRSLRWSGRSGGPAGSAGPAKACEASPGRLTASESPAATCGQPWRRRLAPLSGSLAL